MACGSGSSAFAVISVSGSSRSTYCDTCMLSTSHEDSGGNSLIRNVVPDFVAFFVKAPAGPVLIRAARESYMYSPPDSSGDSLIGGRLLVNLSPIPTV